MYDLKNLSDKQLCDPSVVSVLESVSCVQPWVYFNSMKTAGYKKVRIRAATLRPRRTS